MGFVNFPATAEIAAHNALDTGVHGVGAKVVGFTKIASGNYAGNDTVNRGIPHSLTVIPKMIIMVQDDNPTSQRQIQPGIHEYCSSAAEYHLTVTSADSTNFYVGNATNYGASGNANTKTYYWVAFA